MERHRISGRRDLGLALATTTMLLWGTLPLALKGVLQQLDPWTITWFRFGASSILLAALLGARGALPALRGVGGGVWGLLAVATLFLAANYGGYIVALERTTAVDAQVLLQLAPLLLALGGIVIFGERFSRLQWAGFALLVGGLGVFFAGQIAALIGAAGPYLGAVLIFVFAAVTWAVYGLAQKQLLHHLSSQGIMLLVYVGCTALFAPLASPAAVLDMDAVGIGLLVFCAANTVIAYGAFAESLEHWEASRVSAMLALTPLATLAFTELADLWWPALQDAPPLSAASLLGAVLVVAGSLVTALGDRSAPRP